MNKLKDSIQKLSDEFNQSIVALRKHLHMNPELSFKEYETAKRIVYELELLGIPTFSSIAGTGVIGIIEGLSSGPTLGIRAELDALPLEEKTQLNYSSLNPGIMHACGHDIHMANLVGVAKVLWNLRSEIKGTILLIFQPGEELLPGGAKSIMESDVFRSNQPDMMMGLHILPELPMGKVGFRSGQYMASGDEIYITVKGKGGHAALPKNLIDPVPISAQIIIALQQMVSTKKPEIFPTILAFGKVVANGATNVIPDEVRIEGTFRTMDEDWRKLVHLEIERIAIGIAESMGAKCDVEIRKGYPSVINNPELNTLALNLSAKYIGKQNVVELPIRMTTDDFAYYAAKIPSVYFRIGTGTEGSEIGSLHSSYMVVNDGVLKHSVEITSWLAINILSNFMKIKK